MNEHIKQFIQQDLQVYRHKQPQIPIRFLLPTDCMDATITLGEQWSVYPDNMVFRLLREKFGKTAILVNYRRKS